MKEGAQKRISIRYYFLKVKMSERATFFSSGIKPSVEREKKKMLQRSSITKASQKVRLALLRSLRTEEHGEQTGEMVEGNDWYRIDCEAEEIENQPRLGGM